MDSSPPPTSELNIESPIDVDSPIDIDSPISNVAGLGRSSISSQISSVRSPSSSQRLSLHSSRPQQMIIDEKENDSKSESNQPTSLIWGTNINVEDVTRKFKKFINEYTKNNKKVYPSLIEDAIDSEQWNLNLDCNNLNDFDNELYTQLIRFPQEILPLFDSVVNTYASENLSNELKETETESDIWVRPFNLLKIDSMRNMNPIDIDSLVSISGMVIRSTTIIPDIQTAFFRCSLCQKEIEIAIDMGRIEEPTICNNIACKGSHTMELIHNRCRFQDKQLVKLQETPECIPDGETPQTIDIYCFDTMVDICKPGDRIIVTGVFRAQPIRLNPKRRTIESVYRTYIDSVHIRKSLKNKIDMEDSKIDKDSIEHDEYYTTFDETDALMSDREQEIETIKELSKNPNIYNILAKSIAPSIYEMEDVKKGILCQLFGSTKKMFDNNDEKHNSGRFRNQLNILLCGDPGTSKSQLLQYVHNISPRGIYTSGKGSSAVGLTAYVTKDSDTGDMILESGALVLSDRGICCIDEFDKMSESARSILHEVMEQQTVSIAKAGIICTLNARTSILAAANPIESRYNPTKSVTENIDLPPSLMSRFDLIYLVLDRPNENLDKKLANHLISLYYNENDKKNYKNNNNYYKNIITQDMLMKYISYSKKHIHPTLSDDACNKLIDGYLEMRSLGRLRGKKTITATPRQLESLIRISESLARMRHSSLVTESDVNEAIRLHKVATLHAATDPRTGAIDLDNINIGRSSAQNELLKEQGSILIKVLKEWNRNKIKLSILLKKYNKYIENNFKDNNNIIQIRETQLKEIIETLEQTEKVRAGDWLQEDPVITILDTSDI